MLRSLLRRSPRRAPLSATAVRSFSTADKPPVIDLHQPTARVVDDAKGPKINGFVYKNKSNNRKRWGHRAALSTIEITGITKG